MIIFVKNYYFSFFEINFELLFSIVFFKFIGLGYNFRVYVIMVVILYFCRFWFIYIIVKCVFFKYGSVYFKYGSYLEVKLGEGVKYFYCCL